MAKRKGRPHNFIDITGKRFGMLLVLGMAGAVGKTKRLSWFCRCDCGVEKVVDGRNMRRGAIVSCGCRRTAALYKHGYSQTRAYQAWAGMMNRCFDQSHQSYDRYGGRGITVCNRWERVENFMSDMGECPPNYQLDRIDNNKGYEPENCRWATKKEQMSNRSCTRFVDYDGVRIAASDLAEKHGIPVKLLASRLDRGWDIKRALTEPMSEKYLTKMLAKKRGVLEWRRSLPDIDGWYWWQSAICPPTICRVRNSHYCNFGTWSPLPETPDETTGEWAGPIPEPLATSPEQMAREILKEK